MRRTYGSKKVATGGLDHREMISVMDEKSSIFEAFYIQNIKQTKRELSCMGSSNHQGVASSKVRKRKYVKRIVKEVKSPLKESLSESVFLTPDRSIRVNKAPDLFDQLLKSSPVCAEPKRPENDDIYDKLRFEKATKTYNRRKIAPKKKFNFSSSESAESDKENSAEKETNETQNVTDIRAHKLLIEKEYCPSTKIDESINKIVQNLALLNNLNSQRSSARSIKKNFRCNKNRLTKNMNTPTLQSSSPLSSTPFTEKFRSKSIYKFSPIPMENLADSPNYVTNDEENNDSVVFVTKTRISKLKKSQSENKVSPLTHLKNKFEMKKTQVNKPWFNETVITPDFSMKSVELKQQAEEKQESFTNSLQTSIRKLKKSKNKNTVSPLTHLDSKFEKNKTNVNKLVFHEGEITPESSENSIQLKQQAESLTSSLQISEVEPFFGFSSDANEPKQDIILYSDRETKSHKKTDISNETKVPEKIKSKDVFDSSIELTELSKPFYGFSNVVNNDEDKESSFVFSVSKKSNGYHKKVSSAHDAVNENDKIQDESDIKSFTNNETENKSKFHGNESFDLTSESNNSLQSQEKASLYDTCNSEQSSLNEDDIVRKEPIVKIEKMDLSLFQKYYKRMPALDSTSEEFTDNEESNNEYASMESNSSQDISESLTDSSKAENDVTDNKVEIESSLDESESDKSIAQDNSSHEEDCISFVTTRKRQEVTNNSTIFILDESSVSSNSECDKTVLSNNKIEKDDKVKGTELVQKYENKIQKVNNLVGEDFAVHDEPKVSFVTTRKSTQLFKESIVPKMQEIDVDKPAIVLQPGKKWERSLSIYRRATTVTDHYDHSLLEDEDLNSKGRKYRQSVINTLELQETIGSISNESFKSRRSTFISKPSRSTIRIVKEPNTRLTLSNTIVLDDLKGFLEDCDDTVVELSKLSITESDRDITVLEKIHDSRVATAREYVLRRCNQTDTLLFDECYPDSLLKNCQKIGEGVYGEVYLYRGIDGRPRVMKIVPIAGSIKVNGEQQKDFDEVISEIVIAMELSALRAPIADINRHFDEGKDVDSLNLQTVENATDVFNEVLAVKCVYGNYPSLLLDRWDLYDEIKGSENDNPAILPPDQQYIVLELANAGQDLESYQFNNAEQAYALFYQVAYGLAVAEEAFQFEHRDLHWGNVLIAPTDQKYATFVLRGRAHRVARCGVAAAIIDYSLSRISLPLAGGGGGDSAALYNDLAADDGLFGAVGDYQFSVYRLMREKLGNDWKNYEPYTNILWLHYIVDKMITALRYKRTNTKTHKQYINKLKEVKERILNYGSATLFVLT